MYQLIFSDFLAAFCINQEIKNDLLSCFLFYRLILGRNFELTQITKNKKGFDQSQILSVI